MKLGPYELNSIITGDARELAESIPDESVDLIFTDPVYDRIEDYTWLAETAARVLKPGGNLVAFCANKTSLEIAGAIESFGLDFCDWLIYREMARRRKRWDKNIIGLYEIAPWFSKGEVRNGTFVKNFSYVANGYIKSFEYHEWSKEVKGVMEWLQAFTHPGAIVFDPFTGGGTVPAVCKMLSRQYLAFEIDPVTADLARQRVELTQAPLFVVEPEQLIMELPIMARIED